MDNVLIVIDMQNDFITGSLKNEDAKKIVNGICEKIKSFKGKIIATRDTHNLDYLQTNEGKNLPIVHCVKNTSGWEIESQILKELEKKDYKIIDKPTFGYLGEWNLENVKNIEICGTCTDICVISNALILKAKYPDANVSVIKNLCAGLTEQKHNEALSIMESCQVKII